MKTPKDTAAIIATDLKQALTLQPHVADATQSQRRFLKQGQAYLRKLICGLETDNGPESLLQAMSLLRHIETGGGVLPSTRVGAQGDRPSFVYANDGAEANHKGALRLLARVQSLYPEHPDALEEDDGDAPVSGSPARGGESTMGLNAPGTPSPAQP